MRRLLSYFKTGLEEAGGGLHQKGPTLYEANLNSQSSWQITTDRDQAQEEETLTLLGLEHPLVRHLMESHLNLGPDARALVGKLKDAPKEGGILTFWHIEARGSNQEYHQRIVPLGVTPEGERSRPIEHLAPNFRNLEPLDESRIPQDRRLQLVQTTLPEMLHRHLEHTGILNGDTTFTSRLIGWVELG
jgi:hypothetical protein